MVRVPAESILKSSLTRNSLALVVNVGVTSALGLGFWIVAARLFSEEEVGIGAALVSAIMLLGGLSQLNFNNILLRFLSVPTVNRVRLILIAHAVTFIVAITIAVIYLLTVIVVTPALAVLTATPGNMLIFVLSVMAWTAFSLQDSVLSGLRSSVWVPIKNGIYAIAKLILLCIPGLAAMGSPIFAASILPLPFIIGGLSMVAGRAAVAHGEQDVNGPLGTDAGDLRRFFGWDYLGSTATLASSIAVKLLVLNIAGSSALGVYHIADTVSYSLYLLSAALSASLLAEGAADPERLRHYTSRTAVHLGILILLSIVVIVIGAPLILSLFGRFYSEEGSLLLRLLSIAAAPAALVTLYMSVARLKNDLAIVAGLQAAVLVLLVVVGTPLLYRLGAVGVGYAMIIAWSSVAIYLLLRMYRRNGAGYLLGWAFTIMDEVRQMSRLALGIVRRPHADDERLFLTALLNKNGLAAEGSSCSILSRGEGGTGIDEWLFDGANLSGSSPAQYMVWVGKNAHAARVLAQRASAISQIRDLVTDSGIAGVMPKHVAFATEQHFSALIQCRPPGFPGDRAILDPATREIAMSAVFAFARQTHDLTSQAIVIDDDWIKTWIDEPVDELLRSPLLSAEGKLRRSRLLALRSRQQAFWTGKHELVGLGHWSIRPESVVFRTPIASDANDASTKSEAEIISISDWHCARGDAPAGLTETAFEISCRALLSDQTLASAAGEICGNLQRKTPFGTTDRQSGSGVPGTAQQELSDEHIRMLAGLVWLHATRDKLLALEEPVTTLWAFRNLDSFLWQNSRKAP